jgi:hypothetical protein
MQKKKNINSLIYLVRKIDKFSDLMLRREGRISTSAARGYTSRC